MLFHLNTFEPP